MPKFRTNAYLGETLTWGFNDYTLHSMTWRRQGTDDGRQWRRREDRCEGFLGSLAPEVPHCSSVAIVHNVVCGFRRGTNINISNYFLFFSRRFLHCGGGVR